MKYKLKLNKIIMLLILMIIFENINLKYINKKISIHPIFIDNVGACDRKVNPLLRPYEPHGLLYHFHERYVLCLFIFFVFFVGYSKMQCTISLSKTINLC